MILLHLLHLSLLLAGSVSASPALQTRTDTVVRRADGDGALSGPQTVTTHHTTTTPMGPMTEVCQVILTPITLPDGKAAVEEVRKCKLQIGTGGDNTGGNQSGSGTNGGDNTGGSTTSSSSTAATTTAESSSSSSSSTSSSATATTTSADGSNGGITVNGVTSVPATPDTTTSSSSSTSPSAAPTPPPPPPQQQAPPPSPAASQPPVVNNDNGASASAAAAQSTSTAFSVPGKKLSVLPIGLGVFAGISVIALIVVGLVTYERTKYRKAFRQRKLAEAGANMGYGGMSQRV